MSKVFIRSRDQGYAQYLKSLIQQVPSEPELEVHYVSGPQSRLHEEEQSGLLVIYQSWAGDVIEPFVQSKSWDRTIWITYSAAEIPLQTSGSRTVYFCRPMDSADFVYCVFQWCQKKCGNCGHLKQAPAEPFLVGNSQAVRQLRKNIALVSEYDLAVLVCGATGTGKGVVARALHNNSSRSSSRFVTIDCANVPVSLLESELFGYKKGSFTGAWADKSGRMELAREGTVFLDEISETSSYMQAKLLQVLQEKEFYPVGGMSSVQIKARVVAATNADLKKAIASGTFRKDLYYRLAVVLLELPKLKDRKRDIPVLVHYFLDKYTRLYQKQAVPVLSDSLFDLMMAYDWPGNVRELENSIKSLVALGTEEFAREYLSRKQDKIPVSGNFGELLAGRTPGMSFDSRQEPYLHEMSLPEIVDETTRRIEVELISKALATTGGIKKQTAQVLDISYKSLLNKIKRYGL